MTRKQAKEADLLLRALEKNREIHTMSLDAYSEETGLSRDKIHHYSHLLNYEEYLAYSDFHPHITGKGSIFLASGGYTRKARNEQWNNIWIIIAAIASVVSVVIGLISLSKTE